MFKTQELWRAFDTSQRTGNPPIVEKVAEFYDYEIARSAMYLLQRTPRGGYLSDRITYELRDSDG